VRPCLKKKPSQKRVGGVAQGVGPEINTTTKKRKKINNKNNKMMKHFIAFFYRTK
jgi:hypothetical protein